jgi:hypothetical protein
MDQVGSDGGAASRRSVESPEKAEGER